MNEDDTTKQTASIQRNINKEIEKSKGLIRKRKKENRTPHLRYRNKFEKAEKVRKTQVRDVQEGQAQPNYSGEASGIRQGIIKTTKIK
jgi:U3 small nucleolar RNA-associated protein 3